MISVALPVWNSKRIAWLPMESLCRQIKPENGWELIIFEESHSEQLGEEFFMDYEKKLKEVGCERVKYITSRKKYPLPQKWVKIAKETSELSEAFLMCAADNYYHKWMLCDTEKAIKEADWCLMTKGFFYDFSLNKVVYYNYTGLVGLHMAANTRMVKKFSRSNIERGVDGWFSNQMIKVAHDEGILLKCFIDGTEHWKHTICTNGLNNISKGRISYLKKEKHPFYKTDVKLSDIVPDDICVKLKMISYSMKINDDLG